MASLIKERKKKLKLSEVWGACLEKKKKKGKEAIRPEETKRGGGWFFRRKLLIYEDLTV
jgi:hypothetical protein